MVVPSVVTLAPLALGTQAGAAAITLDIGTRRAAPSAPQATAASPGNSRIRLQWIAPEEAGSLPIIAYTARVTKYKATCVAAGKPIKTLEKTTASMTVMGLVSQAQYKCSVRGSNEVGYGPASAAVNATPK